MEESGSGSKKRGNIKASTVKVRYGESKMAKDMRENFEKKEKIAMRSSRTYREVTKHKKEKAKDIEELAKKGAGEYYVDTARQIAVGMGVTDVKDTLQDFEDQITNMNRMTPADEQNLHILIEQASYELRQYKPEKSLKFISAGLKKSPQCLELLELKGKCYIAMNRYREALEAADTILINPYNLNWSGTDNVNSTALSVKAYALYNLGDFEHALLSFHRALKTSNMQNRITLMQGIKLAELGVMIAVGSTKTPYFRDLNKIVNQMPVNLMGIPWYKLKDYIEKDETCVSRKKHDKKFLDRLAVDKQYLEDIIEKVAPTKRKSKSNATSRNNQSLSTTLIINEAKTAVEFLEERREFWSQQNPDNPKKLREQKETQEPEKGQSWDNLKARVGPQKVSLFQSDR